MSAKYLRQKGTGRIFPYTDAIARRKDMIEVSEDTVKTRIEAVRKRNEEMKAQLATKKNPSEAIEKASKELAELEAEGLELQKKIIEADSGIQDDGKILTSEQEEAKALQETIDSDPEIIKIKTMTIEELADYLASEYGITVTKKEKADVEAVRTKALEQRTARIKETA